MYSRLLNLLLKIKTFEILLGGWLKSILDYKDYEIAHDTSDVSLHRIMKKSWYKIFWQILFKMLWRNEINKTKIKKFYWIIQIIMTEVS